MAAPSTGGAAAGGTPEIVVFNRWLCMTRFRAAGGVAVFAVVLTALDLGHLALFPVLGVCAAMFAVSAVGLTVTALGRVPFAFFLVQTLADVAGITVGIGLGAHGLVALLFRTLYCLVVVPASLVSVGAGLATAVAASVGHLLLLGYERGFAPEAFVSLEGLLTPFILLLLSQQCFFYGAHLQRKNVALGGLATRLEENRRRLVSEAKMSAALLDVARTLGSTLDAPQLLARLNSTTRQQLGADWSATYLVDADRQTFRIAAVTDAESGSNELGRLEFPARGWAPVERLEAERVVVLFGDDAQRTPGLFASRKTLSTVLLVGLYSEKELSGFLAVGFGILAADERERTVDFLKGIAQHATIVLRNARLLEEVQLASAMKSEFVGAISHELRSPLNVMLGYLEMTLDGEFGSVSDEMRSVLRRVQQQSLALLEMITALLDLNRLDAGRLPVQRGPVHVAELLEEIRHQLPETWRKPDVELKLAVVPRLPAIETDAGKLRTIVRNLLHNAFKFTERGHVTLGAGLAPDGSLTISVTDTGCGIPPDAVKYIFELFRQVPGSGGGGVGLGLHLVKRLATALGGTVSVSTQVGHGTCFTVTLPRTAPVVGSVQPAPRAGARAAHAA
jgi:signal transduction histidine kinase